MLSKNKIKLITSLAIKKHRDATALFIAEGDKCVTTLLSACHCATLVATPEWLSAHPAAQADEIFSLPTSQDIKKISTLTTPAPVLALFQQKQSVLCMPELADELVLFLDTIQDPGNLGTIVRIADWFGIHHIVCTPTTADIHSPKAIQATMGAYAHVSLHYAEPETFFTAYAAAHPHNPIYGTFLDGDDIRQVPLVPHGIIVMGNEGNGISTALERYVTQRLFIPSYAAEGTTSESLNVAVATGIACYEFRRRLSSK